MLTIKLQINETNEIHNDKRPQIVGLSYTIVK